MIEYCEQFTLTEGDFDHNDNVKISTILDLFQTVAANHASEGGIGFSEMMEKGLAWIITKIKFDCFAPLYYDRKLIVKSVPKPKGLVDYTRDYFIYNECNNMVAKGSSQWVLIDFKARKIVRPIVDFVGEFSPLTAYSERKIEKIEPVKDIFCFDYEVKKIDLDHNGHLNNIRYADIIFNCETDCRPAKKFIINFNNEALLGNTVSCFTDNNGKYSAFIGEKCCFSAFVLREEF